MSKVRKNFMIISAAALAALAIIAALIMSKVRTGAIGESISLISRSPDTHYRIQLIELPRFDRNFDVRVEDLRSRTVKTIFRSPDEERPAGSERIIWSSDSSKFVLLGRHFFVNDAARLPGGERLYLMYDLSSGRLWCNAAQRSGIASFTLRDVEHFRWNDEHHLLDAPTTQPNALSTVHRVR